MTILYIDNFRGFQSTYIPLREINFFVGENSTGKSSILKLLGILSSQGFWRYNIFGEKETSLGNFSEIITQGSDKAYFEIAFVGTKSETSAVHSAVKFRFIEKDGYPVPKEISYRDDLINLQVTIEGRLLKYRYQMLGPEEADLQDVVDFKNWIGGNNLKSEIFKRTNLDVTSSLAILRQLQIIISLDKNKSHKKASVNISAPEMLTKVAWFAPSVVAPEKVYNLMPLVFTSTGLHFATLLQDIIEGPNVKQILSRFGKDSGLFDDVNVKKLDTIADDAFEIQITIGNKKLNLVNVGYGVSQILPLILEAIARPDGTWLSCQQPETHLHPRAQAAFGEFIFKSNQLDHQKFIVETHSDYIIDRYRLRLKRAIKEDQKSQGGQVAFFHSKNNQNYVELIDIQPDGSYADKQPAEFRDFFLTEQLNLLRL